MSEVDDSGTGHILLCRAIMGSVEKIEAGSLQHRPSSDEFDGGVDDLDNPKWYIVWSTHMNTHILLEYVISYRFSKQSQGLFRSLNSSRKLPVSSLPFSRVFAEIGRTLPSSTARALELTYRQYRVNSKPGSSIFESTRFLLCISWILCLRFSEGIWARKLS